MPLDSTTNRGNLFRFIKKSHAEGYSGVRKRYEPGDPQLSVEKIVDEMKTNLTFLYPLYDLMAHRQKVTKQGKPKIDVTKLFGGNVKVKQEYGY